MKKIVPASRLDGIELSLIRQVNALATPESINLGLGEPNIEPDAELREMAARVAASGSWRYTENAGSLTLRNKIAAALSTPADPVTEVCVTAGTEEALYAIMQAWVGPGDEVLVPDPGFVSYPTLVKLAGGTVVPYPLEPGGWDLDPEAITSRIGPRTRLVVVNSPSNPLGSIARPESLRSVARLAAERKVLVVSDEVYSEIYYGEPPASMHGMGANVIVVTGMSKSHAMTGLRLGWVVASSSVMRPIVTAHQYVTTCASAFSQSLALAIFENEGWNRTWLAGVREQFLIQQRAALTAIEEHLEVPIPPPAGAFYAFVPVPSCDTVSLAKALAVEAGVLAVPGVAFGSKGEGFLRLSYAAAPKVVTSGIARIGAYLRRMGK